MSFLAFLVFVVFISAGFISAGLEVPVVSIVTSTGGIDPVVEVAAGVAAGGVPAGGVPAGGIVSAGLVVLTGGFTPAVVGPGVVLAAAAVLERVLSAGPTPPIIVMGSSCKNPPLYDDISPPAAGIRDCCGL
jgi:hypothetical protein